MTQPKATILLDSISHDGVRLTTMEVVMHRFVLAELNTHRVFSRNSSSSRAIPYHKIRNRVVEDPALPVHWGAEQKGMQSGESLDDHMLRMAQTRWRRARDLSVTSADVLHEFGLHKSLTNRLLEPFMWHTVIVTSTYWDNFFSQRCHKDAQPEIKAAADDMLRAYNESIPKLLAIGEWHTPLIQEDDYKELEHVAHKQRDLGLTTLSVENESIELRKQISVARCARSSYLNHHGVRELAADFDLYSKLLEGMHPSPFEHIASPCSHMAQIYKFEDEGDAITFDFRCRLWGNFYGWHQHRKSIPGENRTNFDYTRDDRTRDI